MKARKSPHPPPRAIPSCISLARPELRLATAAAIVLLHHSLPLQALRVLRRAANADVALLFLFAADTHSATPYNLPEPYAARLLLLLTSAALFMR